ncbi:3-oxoacid CoA-transferase subunit A [Oligella ureolytica]
MLNKILDTHLEALEPIKDGSSILIGGFGDTAIPFELLESLRILNRKDLVIISNNAGTDEVGIAGLIKNKQVRKIVEL